MIVSRSRQLQEAFKPMKTFLICLLRGLLLLKASSRSPLRLEPPSQPCPCFVTLLRTCCNDPRAVLIGTACVRLGSSQALRNIEEMSIFPGNSRAARVKRPLHNTVLLLLPNKLHRSWFENHWQLRYSPAKPEDQSRKSVRKHDRL